MSTQIISAALGIITTLVPGVAPAIPAVANPIINLGYAQYQGSQSVVTGYVSTPPPPPFNCTQEVYTTELTPTA